MSVAKRIPEPSVSETEDSPRFFTQWKPEGEREPTIEQETEARERTLTLGNKTHFKPKDMDEDNRSYYRRLDRHNRDCFWQYRADVKVSQSLDFQYKRTLAIALSGQLNLSPHHSQIVLERLLELDLQRFGMRTDVVTLCLCALVINEEAQSKDRDKVYHPARSAENNNSAFAEVESQLIERHGLVSKRYIQSVFGKLQQGNPPSRSADTWQFFVRDSPLVPRIPSYPPDWTTSSD